MGFRMYLATMDKGVCTRLQTAMKEEFEELVRTSAHNRYPAVYNLPTIKERFCLGAVRDNFILDALLGEEESYVPLFQEAFIEEIYEDNYLAVIQKEGLIRLIEAYRTLVKESYLSLTQESKEDPIPLEKRQQEFLEDRLDKWNSPYVDYLDTDESKPDSLHHFWEYEYLIFTLIHLLKTINWETDELVAYGC